MNLINSRLGVCENHGRWEIQPEFCYLVLSDHKETRAPRTAELRDRSEFLLPVSALKAYGIEVMFSG